MSHDPIADRRRWYDEIRSDFLPLRIIAFLLLLAALLFALSVLAYDPIGHFINHPEDFQVAPHDMPPTPRWSVGR
jgi:hypothetical protein